MHNTTLINRVKKRCILLIIFFVICAGCVTNCIAYGENASDKEINEMQNEINKLTHDINKMDISRKKLAYFPMLKVRTGTYNDSILYDKLQRIRKTNFAKIARYDDLEEIRNFLIEIRDAIQDIAKFEKMIDANPPSVNLKELYEYRKYCLQRQQGKNIEITLDTTRLNEFFLYEYFISFARGTEKYKQFQKRIATEPFLEILKNMEKVKNGDKDTLVIIESILKNIIQADERVRMLVFGYYGSPVAREIRIELNSRYVDIRRKKRIKNTQDSAYVELFCSQTFKTFGEIYKEYSQKIDSMNIAIKYGELYNPDFFDVAPHLKEYLKENESEKGE